MGYGFISQVCFISLRSHFSISFIRPSESPLEKGGKMQTLKKMFVRGLFLKGGWYKGMEEIVFFLMILQEL